MTLGKFLNVISFSELYAIFTISNEFKPNSFTLV